MDFWSLRIDVLAKGQTIPILSHVFFGPTKESVNDSLVAHTKDDVFLESAYRTGKVGEFLVDVTVRYTQHKGKRNA